MEGTIAVLVLFGLPGIYLFGKTEVGQAIVERIRHGAPGRYDPELISEVEDLRGRLAEMEERLDFAERQLATRPAPRSLHPTPDA